MTNNNFSSFGNNQISQNQFGSFNSPFLNPQNQNAFKGFDFSASANTANTANTAKEGGKFLNGAIGEIGSGVMAVANVANAINAWKTGKASIKAMNRQLDQMEQQQKIENERFTKREEERLQNNDKINAAASDYELPTERV